MFQVAISSKYESREPKEGDWNSSVQDTNDDECKWEQSSSQGVEPI